MKNITRYLLTFLILKTQVGINENGDEPDSSTMLDVSSTDKSLLIPRMDSTARNAISNPATGLMVYDSRTNSFWYYSTSWQEIGGGTFISENGVTSSTNDDDDFVFGADSLNYGGSGSECKFFQ